jgi:predicted metal-dependent hydrolase
MAFEESFESVPRHFGKDNDIISSHVLAALSSMFPDGEDYFVRSVRNFRDRVEDPELKRQVAGFIGQEAVHGREHRAFNDRLAQLGYPSKGIETLVRRSLTFRERVLPPISNLAVTAALEHLTATLAELVLTDEQTRLDMGDPAVRDLFVWHALEESEHKAVAFDVYRTVGGTERMRVMTMRVILTVFPVVLAAITVISLLKDGAAYRPVRLARSVARFARSPLASREFRRQLRTYNRRDFHPDDHDTTALVDQWREELFGSQGSLVSKLR